jgi:hypothetical protein
MSDFITPVDQFYLPDVPKNERLLLAHEYWFRNQPPSISIAELARKYGVSRSTLDDRIKRGVVPRAEANQAMQRLSPGEEQALVLWICQLQNWGWPAKVYQVRGMAQELLQAKGDTKELGIHWTEQFLLRHPSLKSKFVGGLDKTRVSAQDPSIISAWFELVDIHGGNNGDVEKENIWNMDEKGIMMGANEKVKCIISKHEKKVFMTTTGNREWVSLIEAVSMTGKSCPSWVILKGKLLKASWAKHLNGGHIGVSENGWTDIELGMAWLRDHFYPNTLRLDNEGRICPRILIYDGHSSHISSTAIQFCLANGIQPLCLPRHSTHFLQPLDVSVFNALAHFYKKVLAKRCMFSAHFSVDKIDFLELLHEARKQTFTPEIVVQA